MPTKGQLPARHKHGSGEALKSLATIGDANALDGIVSVGHCQIVCDALGDAKSRTGKLVTLSSGRTTFMCCRTVTNVNPEHVPCETEAGLGAGS